ncbi:MAG: SUMF1/EgtB/PvdO family nonheme iron enzyme [bacterium]
MPTPAAFVEAGYGDPDGKRPPWWKPEGWPWRRDGRVEHPQDWYVQRQSRPADPVVGVSFYEAEAYAAWLGHTG